MTEHVNMADFIAPRSDQLNSDELIDGPRTITITKVTASPDAAEQPVSIHFQGDSSRPYKPCKTVRRILVGVWGKDASKYVGRSMTLYRDPTVAFGGMQVGGIRVSHMSDISEKKTVALQVTRGRKAPFTIQPLKAVPQQQQQQQPAAEPETDVFGLEPVPAGPSKAEQWVDTYLASVADCATIEDLMTLQAASAKALAKLQTDKPDLHELTVNAGTARAAALQAEAVE